MENPLLALKDSYRVKHRIQRSTFIGFAFPVISEEEVKEHLRSLRREYPDATHIPYAYVLADGKSFASDDGEPRHSAGDPMLAVIKGKGVVNVLIAVVRYFGGVKLGIGGLMRAFSGVAKDLLDHAELEPFIPKKRLLIEVPYEYLGVVLGLLNRFGAKVVGRENKKAGALLTAEVGEEGAPALIEGVLNAGKGNILLKQL